MKLYVAVPVIILTGLTILFCFPLSFSFYEQKQWAADQFLFAVGLVGLFGFAATFYALGREN